MNNLYIFFSHIVAESVTRLSGAGVMGWAYTLEISGWMPYTNFRLLFHEALLFTYLRYFFVFFVDDLIGVNETSLPDCWESWAVSVGLGRPMVFWKATDLIRNVSGGRQV